MNPRRDRRIGRLLAAGSVAPPEKAGCRGTKSLLIGHDPGENPMPHRPRQLRRHLGRLRQPLLTRPLPHRRGRLHPLRALRRGRLRRERRGDPGALIRKERDPRHTPLTYEVRCTSTVWLDAWLLVCPPYGSSSRIASDFSSSRGTSFWTMAQTMLESTSA